MNHLAWTILLSLFIDIGHTQLPQQPELQNNTQSKVSTHSSYIIYEYPGQIVEGKIIYQSNHPQNTYKYKSKDNFKPQHDCAACYSDEIQDITYDKQGNWIIRVHHTNTDQCLILERKIYYKENNYLAEVK